MSKFIEGYDDKYQITSSGEVVSLHGSTPKLLKGEIDKDGYRRVRLYSHGESKKYFVHRLVATHFLDIVEGCDIVNHINENKLDNRVENLEWTTAKGNANHGTRNSRMAKSKYKRVCQVKDGVIIKRFDSLVQAQEETGVRYSGISACCHGKQKTSGGYEWEFEI